MNRCVITGMGLVSSLGSDRKSAAESFRKNRTAFRSVKNGAGRPDFDGLVICPVPDMGDDAPFAFLSSWRHRRYLSRGAFLDVLAGLRAALSAGFEGLPEDCVLSGTAAPSLDFERESGLPPAPPAEDRLDALWLLRWLPNTATTVLASLLGARGAGLTYGSACASGLIALGEGFLRIRHGLAGTVLVHAGDSRLSSGALLGYAKAHTLSHHLSPDASSLPFDRDRRGFVPGEGGAAFVLEERSAAQKRGARILAEITGYAATLDGGALTAPDPKGIQAEKAVRRALAMADLTPGDIDFVSPHGTGTGLNDAMEAGLLARVFPGKDGPAVTAFKSWTGHLASACGAVETALAIICAQERITPPVRGLRHPLTDSLRFVLPGTAPAPDVFKPGSCGLVENFGFGGQNAALCLRVEA